MEGCTEELQESHIRNKIYVSVCEFSPFRSGGCMTVTGEQEAGEGGSLESQHLFICGFSPFRSGGCMTVIGGQEAGGEGPWSVNIISYVDFLHSGMEAA